MAETKYMAAIAADDMEEENKWRISMRPFLKLQS